MIGLRDTGLRVSGMSFGSVLRNQEAMHITGFNDFPAAISVLGCLRTRLLYML